MFNNNMKRATSPNSIDNTVKNLKPISDKKAENLHEELSLIFQSEVLGMYTDEEEEYLAVDLKRLQEGMIDSLSGGLWGRWKKVRLNTERVKQSIRGMKKVETENVSPTYDDGKRKDKHKRRMKQVVKDSVTYTGGYFLQEDLSKYYDQNRDVLNVSFNVFVDGILPALAMSPSITSIDSNRRPLGIRVPKCLLTLIEEYTTWGDIDVNSEFKSVPSKRQVDMEIRRYILAITKAVAKSVDLAEELSNCARGINDKKSQKYYSNSLVLADVWDIGKYSFNEEIFEEMYDNITVIESSVYPFIADNLNLDDVEDLDDKLLKQPEMQEVLRGEIKTLAETLFENAKNDLTQSLNQMLTEQKELVEQAFKKQSPIQEVVGLLKKEKATWKDVRNFVIEHSRNKKFLNLVFNEVFGGIETENFVKRQIKEVKESKKVKKNGKEVEIKEVVGISLKKAGRKKLDNQVRKVFNNQDNAFTKNLINFAFHFVVGKIKEEYVSENGLSTNLL